MDMLKNRDDRTIERTQEGLDFEFVIVGAGLSGIAAGIELKNEGIDSFVLLESADELGGTWRDNTYPGVAVDIPSISYSFKFELAYPWSRAFAPGDEILAYLKHCSRKYGIDAHIRYGSNVLGATFDEKSDTWTTHLAERGPVRSRYLVAATGILSQPKIPYFPGQAEFEGAMMHTARWDHSVDLAGKRVAIIGTGASAVQVAPAIAPEVAELTVYQRTPIWVGPKRNPDLTTWWIRLLRSLPFSMQISRLLGEWGLELLTFGIVNYQRWSGQGIRWLERAQERWMRRSLQDEELQAKMIPKYGFGCKRPAISSDYLSTFLRDNVALETEPIERLSKKGIVTTRGAERVFDVIVLATGFRTLEPGNAPSFRVEGVGGAELGKYWDEHRYQAYFGTSVPGFPNFFLTSSPYSGGLNWFAMIDAHLVHILRVVRRARRRGATRVEVKRSAHEAYFSEMLKRSERAVFKAPSCVDANSYYLDRHGDASLPYPATPLFRWFRVRLSRLDAYRFTS